MKVAMILGGAECVWRDVARLETMVGRLWPGVIIAVNDVGCVWARHLDHWVTMHPEKMHRWIGRARPVNITGGWWEERERRGYNAPQLWTHLARGRKFKVEDANMVDGYRSGSSAYLAFGVARRLGLRAILCGVPMEQAPHFIESTVHKPGTDWTAWKVHRKAWEQDYHRVAPFVRSMSGWTRDLFGLPTNEWLEEDL